MDPAERIKAALARPEATRQVLTAPEAIEPKAEVESTLSLLGSSDEVRATVPSEGLKSTVSSKSELERNVKSETVAVKRESTTDAGEKPNHSRRIYIAFGVCALVVVGALVVRQSMTPAAKPAPPVPALQVEVRPEGKGLLNIRWNAQAAAITSAREGRLVVLEANQQPRIIPLQADELKIGHVYYQSSVERQEFRLEVVNGSGAVVRESVLAVSPGVPEGTAAAAASEPTPPPTPAQKQQPAVTAPQTANAARPVPTAPTAAPPATTAVAAPIEVVKITPTPKQFTPPPVNKPAAEEVREAVLDAAPLQTGMAAPARVNLPALNAPAPPSVAGASRSQQHETVVSSKVEPATLLRKVAPIYPAIAKTARIEGTVVFSGTIDKTGRVQNLRVMSGPQMLVQAASEAVKKWLYKPMMLDGKPSEVITQLEVKFSLGH